MKYFLILLSIGLLSSAMAMTSKKPVETNQATTLTVNQNETEKNQGADESGKSGKDCKTGCSLGDEKTESLSDKKIEELLVKLKFDMPNTDSINLDTLLFYADSTRGYLKNKGDKKVPAVWKHILKDELKHTNFKIEIRVLNEAGKKIINFKEKVALEEKYHLHHKDIVKGSELTIGGRSKRVGLHHIWARF